jgi:hypothetical protein
MGIGENLSVGGKNETGAKSSPKFWECKGANTLIVSFYIYTHYRRPNTFSGGGHCM